jgi:amino acid transporter
MSTEKVQEPAPVSEGLIAKDTNGTGQAEGLDKLGYVQELTRNRSLFTLLFQTLAIAAIPYGEGGPLMSAIYGGGPLSIFVGWIVVCILDECVALSLAELASRWPTSAGPYYWSFQIVPQRAKVVLSFINGWVWLIGNWTITLSVNFGFASLLSGTISMYHPDWSANDWQLLLIFYAICLASFIICTFGNRFLPMIDTICAAWTAISILIIMIALSVKADVGRHDASYALGHYDTSLSGWGGFTFFIGLLPAAYCFSAVGMIASMAEECSNAVVKVPQAISLCVPVGGIAGLFFIIPICVTLPPLEDIILAPAAQALPYIFQQVMGSPGGGLGLIFLVLAITLFCSISITVAASRTTYAFARDEALPLSKLWAKVNSRLGVPVWSLVLVTVVQMLLGLINLGSSSAFTAFVSVGVVALAISYAIPIGASVFHKRQEVNNAKFNCGPVLGLVVNIIALVWIAFELVLFCMPTVLPVTAVTMNYAAVVFVGFMAISAVWYGVYARKSKCCSFRFGYD